MARKRGKLLKLLKLLSYRESTRQKILLRDISVEILGPEASSDDLKVMGRRLSNLFRDRLGFIVKVEGKNRRWVYLPAMHAAKLLEIDLLFPYS